MNESPNGDGVTLPTETQKTHNWGMKWTEDEDMRLIEGVRVHGLNDWKTISELVGTRTSAKCSQRWEKVLRPGLVKGKWTDEEDDRLRMVVREGFEHWGKVAERMPGRTSKQCRERWANYLDPSLLKTPFSSEEDAIIIEMQRQVGNKWALISRQLPGRTENGVKLRFNWLSKQIGDNYDSTHSSGNGSFVGNTTAVYSPSIEFGIMQGGNSSIHSVVGGNRSTGTIMNDEAALGKRGRSTIDTETIIAESKLNDAPHPYASMSPDFSAVFPPYHHDHGVQPTAVTAGATAATTATSTTGTTLGAVAGVGIADSTAFPSSGGSSSSSSSRSRRRGGRSSHE
mmetsp:Transcript_18881/g.31865  ORF Transcript_18881/g.31865 Transcript_18881/m.31865 type:complete len:341 (-) Transcript_18881:194-1216(-)